VQGAMGRYREAWRGIEWCRVVEGDGEVLRCTGRYGEVRRGTGRYRLQRGTERY
jgi:hypothetical protein